MQRPVKALHVLMALAIGAAVVLMLTACSQSIPVPVNERDTIMFSYSPDRSDPHILDGAAVTGDIYVFTVHTDEVVRVVFWLDDHEMSGPETKREEGAPFDLVGTYWNGEALPLNSRTLSFHDEHSVFVKVRRPDFSDSIAGAVFTVENPDVPLPTATVTPSSAPPPAPTPTATPTPTVTPEPTTRCKHIQDDGERQECFETWAEELNQQTENLNDAAVVRGAAFDEFLAELRPTLDQVIILLQDVNWLFTPTPVIGPPPTPPAPYQLTVPLDLNAANAAELVALNQFIGEVKGETCRIGPATAQNIVSFIDNLKRQQTLAGEEPVGITALSQLIPVSNVTVSTITCLDGDFHDSATDRILRFVVQPLETPETP